MAVPQYGHRWASVANSHLTASSLVIGFWTDGDKHALKV
jgi:hypothetical protein